MGHVTVTAVDRDLGIMELSRGIDQLREVSADAYEFRLASYPAIMTSRPGFNCRVTLVDSDDIVNFDTGMVITAIDGPMTAMSVGIAAACAIGGLAWMIHRRNLLAGDGPASPSLLKAAAQWLADFFRKLLGQPLQLTEADLIEVASPNTELALPAGEPSYE